jgi:hypothetical protein
MTATRSELRGLVGRQVCVTQIDGTQLDACRLVSAGRARGTLWLFADGADTFIPLEEVVDIRASAPPCPARSGRHTAGLVDHLPRGVPGCGPRGARENDMGGGRFRC